ncbi:MAG: hypothetical protein NXI35_21795 [bacterium]|nr:hypothetical protein [bacterium]
MHDLVPAVLGLALVLPACDGGEETGTDSDGMSGSTSGGSDSDSDSASSGASASASASGSSGATTTPGSTSQGSTSQGSSTGAETSSGESTDAGSSSGDTTGSGASLPDGFEDTLEASGCGDMVVYGRSDDDTIALVMHIDDELVADAAASGEIYEATRPIEDFVTFEVLVGAFVSAPLCNDVIIEETVVEQTWVATAGSVDITIDPVEGAAPFEVQGYATMELSAVEVTYEGVTETLEDVVLADVAVGWLPG